jgi:hypothetical protein|tara:strand:- start:301 stop:525 length:225 start_codon:yes stop_codon:yes gene_type:complete
MEKRYIIIKFDGYTKLIETREEITGNSFEEVFNYATSNQFSFEQMADDGKIDMPFRCLDFDLLEEGRVLIIQVD